MSEENGLVNYNGKKSGRGVRKCKPIQKGDLVPILDLAIQATTQRMGRPAEYPNTRQGLEDFIQKTGDYFGYLQAVNNADDREDGEQGKDRPRMIPDVESWCLYLGITRMTVHNYQSRGKEWNDTIEYYKGAIAAAKKQLMLSGKIPPVLAVFDLANNHGYVNTSEFKVITEAPKQEQTQAEELESKLTAAGLIWDCDKQEYVPMPKGGEV